MKPCIHDFASGAARSFMKRCGWQGVAAFMVLCPSQMQAGDIAIRAANNGAVVWRPYAAPLTWTGGVNATGMADGEGRLVIYDKNGREAVAVFDGTMQAGVLGGRVSAMYPTSRERASYVGEFSNWNENGRGTMTMRSGNIMDGYWRDGEYIGNQNDFDRKLMQTIDECEELAAIDWPEVSKTGRLEQAAAKALQTVYDQFKISLRAGQRETLIGSQRAWIVYNKTTVALARRHWKDREDLEIRARQLDLGMTLNRLAELRLAARLLADPEKYGEADTLDRCGDLARQIQKKYGALPEELFAKGTTSPDYIKRAGEVVGLFQIAQAVELPEHRQLVEGTLSEMILSHVVKQHEFWHDGKWLSEEPYRPVDLVKADGELASELLKLKQELVDGWGMTSGKEADWMPHGLPKGVKEAVASADEKLAMFKKEEPAREWNSQACKQWLETAIRINDFADKRGRNADQALDVIEKIVSECGKEWGPWASSLASRLKIDIGRREELLARLVAEAATAGPASAADILAQADKAAPLPEMKDLSAVVDSYVKIFDGEEGWKEGELPPPAKMPSREVLADAAKAAKAFDNRDKPAVLKKALSSYRSAMDCAGMMEIFLEKSGSDGDAAFLTPLLGLKAMRADARFEKNKNSKDPLVSKAFSKVAHIDRVLTARASEMDALIGKGDAALGAGKWTEASRFYRQALAIESWPKIRELAVKAERNLSGL